MTDLVTMIGPRGADDIAEVRPDWVEQWRGYGYITKAEADAGAETPAAGKEAAKKAEEDAAAAVRKALEDRATVLGVEFRSTLGDDKLAERIAGRREQLLGIAADRLIPEADKLSDADLVAATA